MNDRGFEASHPWLSCSRLTQRANMKLAARAHSTQLMVWNAALLRLQL